MMMMYSDPHERFENNNSPSSSTKSKHKSKNKDHGQYKKQKLEHDTKIVKSIETKSGSSSDEFMTPPKFENKKPIYSSTDENEDVKEEPVQKSTDDVYFEGWTKQEIKTLLQRIESAIPKDDTLKYSSRTEKLNWEQIKFGKFDAVMCKEKWKFIEKKMRGYRVLKEVVGDANEWINKPWKDFYHGKKKNDRHPDMPKRPLTSYMIFYLTKKEKIAKQNPGLSLVQLSKLIAEKYNNLSAKKKAKYAQMAIDSKAEYNEKLQKFYHDHPNEENRLLTVSKTRKNPNDTGPPKPSTPLKLFTEHRLNALKDDSDFQHARIVQECKDEWKNMNKKKKKCWIGLAHDSEVKYFEEVKKYKLEHPDYKPPAYKSVLSKEEQKIYNKMIGKPEKPPSTAYAFFSKLMLTDPELKEKFPAPKDRMQEIARIWKTSGQAYKDSYNEKVKHLLENYKLNYATYLETLTEEQREQELAKMKTTASKKKKDPVQKIDKYLVKKERKPKDSIKEEKPENAKLLTEEEIIAKEPKQPPENGFEVFVDEKSKSGDSSSKKHLIKAWNNLDDGTREAYTNKSMKLKQKFILEYKEFLQSLKPEELRIFSSYKKPSETPVENESSSEEENSDSDDDDVSVKKEEESSSSDSDVAF